MEAEEKEQARLDEIEDKAAVARMDAEVERRRVADKDNRATVKQQIYDSVYEILSGDHALSQKILNALVLNKIPNITIKY